MAKRNVKAKYTVLVGSKIIGFVSRRSKSAIDKVLAREARKNYKVRISRIRYSKRR